MAGPASTSTASAVPSDRRWLWVAWLVAVFAVLLPWLPASWHPWPIRALERSVHDRVVLRAASPVPEQRITVIDIDEVSLQAVAPWPWPRARIADLVEALLADYKARAVGLDIVFPAPADPQGDARLAALAQLMPVVLAQVLDFADREPALKGGLLRAGPSLALSPGQRETLAIANGYLANHGALASAAACSGHIGIVNDEDGRIRRVPLVVRIDGLPDGPDAGLVPLLPLALWACPLAQQARAAEPRPLFGLDRLDAWPVPFSRHWRAYDVVSAADVLARRVPADVLQGRWVLVGSSALGLHDRSATPLAPSAASVMVHASVLSTLLDLAEGWRPWPQRVGPALASTWIALTLGACVLAMRRWRAWWLMPVLGLSAAGWLALATAVAPHAPGMAVASPLVVCGLVAALASLELWRVQRDQARVMRFFATYVAPQVVAELMRRPFGQALEPQHRELTVLCADLEGYSRLTADSSLAEAADLTRQLLQRITQPVWDRGGTLDKYTGDGLVAFWGAPLQTADHAEQAVMAAQEMLAAVRAWNDERAHTGKPALRLRVGLETGTALVGDLGSRQRSTYTAVGDCINHASKLQEAARGRSQDMLIGPRAARTLTARLPSVELKQVGHLALAGHAEPASIWSISEPPHA